MLQVPNAARDQSLALETSTCQRHSQKKKIRTGDPKPKLQHLKATEAMRLEHRAKELAAQWVVWVSDSARKEPTGNVLCKSTVS